MAQSVAMGRPSEYTPERAAALCARIASGKSLAAVCELSEMPDHKTVHAWLRAHADFSRDYARACELRAEKLEDSIHDIEAEVLSGSLDPNAARVVIGSRQWRMERMARRKYGVQVGIGGAEDLPAVKTQIDPVEAARTIAFALRAGIEAAKAKPEGEDK